MVDKKEDKEKKEEPAEDKDKAEGKDMIKDAKKTVEEMKEANEEKKNLLDREERLIAEKALSGHADAYVPEKPKEETAKEYKDRVMRGDLKDKEGE